jgi:gas vesicle protein
LADAGISKDLSSKAQKLAAIPADEFEAEVSDWRERIEAENQRVTVRLQQAGERAAPSAAPEPEIAPVDEPVSELQALRDELEMARDVAEDLAHEVETLRAAETVDGAAAEIKRLKAMLRAVESERDTYRAKSTEMLVQIKAMQRKIDRLERAT